MTPSDKNFEEVLGLFEAHGWKLYRTQGCYRIFKKANEYPYVIPVENKKVKAEYVEKIEQFFKEEQGSGEIPN